MPRRSDPGDRLLCYLVRAYRSVGVLRVTGQPYFDEDESHCIWAQDVFPVRVPVEIELELTPETGVLVADMLDQLQATSSIHDWQPEVGDRISWKSDPVD